MATCLSSYWPFVYVDKMLNIVVIREMPIKAISLSHTHTHVHACTHTHTGMATFKKQRITRVRTDGEKLEPSSFAGGGCEKVRSPATETSLAALPKVKQGVTT